ncbi:hypothetical protein B0J12DRAFT_721588 [Macrophomina phaseolina]|uniref:Uncharacterized protein n=1 Tax=Macrophomina phaseolina TaxID=35725 RepID=A0ABQ8FXA8_9PEZI|nr:hypothetical protein B0J12DRAFT_721588 [Macrophomina phaseolina]
MYVENLTPTAGTWLKTRDNRKGFTSYFVEQGYQVYVIEQTSVGRDTENNVAEFPLISGGAAENSENAYTAPEPTLPSPTQLATRSSTPSNPPCSRAPSDQTAQEHSMRHAGCALLALIARPSFFLITHSTGALHGTLLSNDCPALVAGKHHSRARQTSPPPPPSRTTTATATDAGVERTAARVPGAWPAPRLDYKPAAAEASELSTTMVGVDTSARRSCVIQVEPARRLPRVARVPYVAAMGAASPHATYGHCTVGYLKQAGVEAEGILKNGHFLHLEFKGLDSAAAVEERMKGEVGRV